MAKKGYGKRVRMGESLMLKQTEDYMEKEVLPNSNSSEEKVSEKNNKVNNELYKGIVVDIPLNIYRQLRDIKDVTPGGTLKGLALQAIIEFVERKKI